MCFLIYTILLNGVKLVLEMVEFRVAVIKLFDTFETLVSECMTLFFCKV